MGLRQENYYLNKKENEKNQKLRLVALAIDVALIIIAWFLVMFIIIYLFQFDDTYYNNIGISLLISLFLCKDDFNGQSIGKRICKLKIVSLKGQDLSNIKLIGRNCFVFFAPIELILMLYYDRRLGDKIMEAQVIQVNKLEQIGLKNVLKYLLVLFVVTALCLPLCSTF